MKQQHKEVVWGIHLKSKAKAKQEFPLQFLVGSWNDDAAWIFLL